MGTKLAKWSFGYYIGRLFVCLGHNLFYRKIIVRGITNIPKNEPVIFAPNHQNAVMDALAVVCAVKEQVVFMARSDVFSNRLTSVILKFLKIMPVYRMRDGFENLAKNDLQFEEALQILERNKMLCIMPEGNHGDKHCLRPLVKGIFRLSYLFNAKFEGRHPVKIVPVGIDYSNYSSFRSRLIVQFGRPIETLEFYEIYKQNQAQGLNILKERLEVELKKLMIHIENNEYYEKVNITRNLLRTEVMRKMEWPNISDWYKYNADKLIVDTCNLSLLDKEKEMQEVFTEINHVDVVLKEHGIDFEYFEEGKINVFSLVFTSIILIATFPVFIAGYLLNCIPVIGASWVNKKVQDFQFHSTVKFISVLFGYPILYGLYILLMSLVEYDFYIQLISVVFFITSGVFSIQYIFSFRVNWAKMKMVYYGKEFKVALDSLEKAKIMLNKLVIYDNPS